jgi:hypothetical protein
LPATESGFDFPFERLLSDCIRGDDRADTVRCRSYGQILSADIPPMVERNGSACARAIPQDLDQSLPGASATIPARHNNANDPRATNRLLLSSALAVTN